MTATRRQAAGRKGSTASKGQTGRKRPTTKRPTANPGPAARKNVRKKNGAKKNAASKGSARSSRTPARATGGADPRLVARRLSVARQQGAKRLWLIFALTMAATLALAAIGLSNSSLLDVEQVEVVGAARADEGHVLTASGLALGEPLLELDEDGAAAAVAAVPWVASATVDWAWNGAVTITVVERVAVAALPTGPRFAVVDAAGQQLEVVDARPDEFPVITGIEVSGVPGQVVDPVALDAVSISRSLSAELIAVTGDVVVEGGQVFVHLDIGGRANFGDARDLPSKVVALETILLRVDLTCIDVVDLRVPSEPTVRRLPPGTATQETLAADGGC